MSTLGDEINNNTIFGVIFAKRKNHDKYITKKQVVINLSQVLNLPFEPLDSFNCFNKYCESLYRFDADTCQYWRGKSGQRRAPYHLINGLLFEETGDRKCHRN